MARFVFKIKNGDTLRRLNVRRKSNSSGPDITFKGLEAAVRELFGFDSTRELQITYIDRHNEVVAMAENQDLVDACTQGQNTLRLQIETVDSPPLPDSAAFLKNVLPNLTTEQASEAYNLFIKTSILFREASEAYQQFLNFVTGCTGAVITSGFEGNEAKEIAGDEAKETAVSCTSSDDDTNASDQGHGEAKETSAPFASSISCQEEDLEQYTMRCNFHRDIRCDECGMTPLIGPRYKSIKKDDFDLCHGCYVEMGNEADYLRIDRPLHQGYSLRKFRKARYALGTSPGQIEENFKTGRPFGRGHHGWKKETQGRSRDSFEEQSVKKEFQGGSGDAFEKQSVKQEFQGGSGYVFKEQSVKKEFQGDSNDTLKKKAAKKEFQGGIGDDFKEKSAKKEFQDRSGDAFTEQSVKKEFQVQSTDAPKKRPVPKFDARFVVCDVTTVEEIKLGPGTHFTRIWRLKNIGSASWPKETKLIFVGGDELGLHSPMNLELPEQGLPPDEEIDVSVDLVAPTRCGHYTSNWRVMAPTGEKSGHIWVLVQVLKHYQYVQQESLPSVPVGKNSTMITGEKEISNTNISSPPIQPYSKPFSWQNTFPEEHQLEQRDSVDDSSGFVKEKPMIEKPVEADLLSTIQMDSPIMNYVNASESFDLTHVENNEQPANESKLSEHDTSGPHPVKMDGNKEPKHEKLEVSREDVRAIFQEALLEQLESMGFSQRALNLQVLKKNKNNLQSTIEDLLAASKWDPILMELEEMGFLDKMLNLRLMFKNNGSVKRVVKELVQMQVAGEKDSNAAAAIAVKGKEKAL